MNVPWNQLFNLNQRRNWTFLKRPGILESSPFSYRHLRRRKYEKTVVIKFTGKKYICYLQSLSLKISETWRKIIFNHDFFVCFCVRIPIPTITQESKVIESLFLCRNICDLLCDDVINKLNTTTMKEMIYFSIIQYPWSSQCGELIRT